MPGFRKKMTLDEIVRIEIFIRHNSKFAEFYDIAMGVDFLEGNEIAMYAWALYDAYMWGQSH